MRIPGIPAGPRRAQVASLHLDIENRIDHELKLIELNVVSRLRGDDLPAVGGHFQQLGFAVPG
jgi:hypothetical protein